MIIDLTIMGLVALFAILGAFSGFWRQVARLAALALAYLGAWFLGPPVGVIAGRIFGVPPLLMKPVGMGLTFFLLYLILSSAIWVVFRRHKRRHQEDSEIKPARASWDRPLGAVLGAAKAAAVLYLIVSTLVIAQGVLPGENGQPRLDLKGSRAAGWVRQHNALAKVHLPVVGDLDTMGRLATDPGLRERAAADPKIILFLEHPKIRALLEDRALIEASERNDVAAVLGNPQLNQILTDPEIEKLISDIDLSKL